MKGCLQACIACLLAILLLTCSPAVNAIARAQGLNTGIPAVAGHTTQGSMAGEEPVRMMSLDNLNAWKNDGRDFLLIDARSAEQFAMAHIPGALSVPLDQIPLYAGSLDKDRLIVTYCGNYHCPISTKAAIEFGRLGFTNVWDYKGGVKEWQETGYPTAAGFG